MILVRIRLWRRLSTACDPPSGSERRGRKKSRTKFPSSGGRFHLTVSRPWCWALRPVVIARTRVYECVCARVNARASQAWFSIARPVESSRFEILFSPSLPLPCSPILLLLFLLLKIILDCSVSFKISAVILD